jgi:hypothetical protein
VQLKGGYKRPSLKIGPENWNLRRGKRNGMKGEGHYSLDERIPEVPVMISVTVQRCG